MATYLLSDVHLSAERPATVASFIAFLEGAARDAASVYLLGDVFDEWLGDDDHRPPHLEVTGALRRLTANGVPVAVMQGNHDFLLGEDFAARSGCRLIEDPARVEIEGTPVLLMHGDLLCTLDLEYQAFRRQCRDPQVQAAFLAQPLAARMARAAALRSHSRERSALKPEEIMDVTPEAVTATMHAHEVTHLVHGHTHRPAVHRLEVAGEPAVRIVLGDWYEQDSLLAWGPGGFRLGRLEELLGRT